MKHLNAFLLTASICVTVSSTVVAEVAVSHVFSDHMVLRECDAAIWGTASPGAVVTISFKGNQSTAKADENGRWRTTVESGAADSRGAVLTIAEQDDTITIEDVLVGEVWLCSGQSNMQFPMQAVQDFEKEKAEANYPKIRMFFVDMVLAQEPKDDVPGRWETASPDTIAGFSAAAYFFGRELFNELGIPIGLIRSSRGGTRIEPWIPRESLGKFPLAVEYKANLDKQADEFSEKIEEKRYAAVLKKWEGWVETAKAEGKKPPRKPKKRINPRDDWQYPGNIYNAMIHPLVPYAIRGVIWYQGEANAHTIKDAEFYRELLEHLMTEWRGLWNNEFPFYAVQLPNYKELQTQPQEDTPWARIRESFLKFHKEVPGAGIAVTIDAGMADDIHPKNKQVVGYRLAQQALEKTYGKERVSGGPVYAGMKKSNRKIVLEFDEVGSGLAAQGGGPLKRFAIAGNDRRFVDAKAEIVGDTVVVSSDKISKPVAVRYAWADNPDGCNLFNKDGFPASPFRTDEWAAVVDRKAIRQAADQKGKQKGPGNRENPFAELGLTQEQQKKVREFQKSMQAEMKKASESRDREKMQAAQKKRLAGLAKILDEEQMKKYKAAIAKIRKARAAAPQQLGQSKLRGVVTNATNDQAATAKELPVSAGATLESQLREVIVSHTDENGVLQLYRMKEDGSDSRQLTKGNDHCVMPTCSADGKKVVYVQRSNMGMAIWLCDPDGKNAKELIKSQRILVPTWLPDSKHIVWMKTQPGQDPSRKSQIQHMNTETGESRRLFTDPEQLKFSNSMPVVSPQGDRIAFVSNRGGEMRIWVSDIDGSNARAISPVASDLDKTLKLPIVQKVPAWSPDGKWIAHWEGVEMIHLSKFTGKQDRERDKLITQTWNVWVVGRDGKNKRKVGRGDDPTWSPDGFVTRAFPDRDRGGPKIMIETKSGEKELPIVPRKKNWGRFTWLPHKAQRTENGQ